MALRPVEDGQQVYVSVGDLKKYIEKHNIPDDTEVLIQRIEDKYFENCGWTTIPLVFEQFSNQPPHMGEYITCFQAHLKTDDIGTKYLAIEAHY